MGNAAEHSEKRRFDDLVRSERYFTATLLPLLLFHKKDEKDGVCGLRRFVDLVDDKATKEHNKDGEQVTKGTRDYNNFEDVEVITEFHIARDLKFAGWPLDITAWHRDEGVSAELQREALDVEPSEEDEATRSAPDLVIAAGRELVVCEGKFFNGFNTKNLNEQLRSQRHEVRHLFRNREIRAYRHVAILPKAVPILSETREGFDSSNAVDADAVITWGEIRDLASDIMGSDHYVTDRLRCAVHRVEDDDGPDIPCPSYVEKLPFSAMREKCRKEGNKIQVGHVGGADALLTFRLVDAERKLWKWRYPDTPGRIIPGNWLPGARWLEIVESAHGFGGKRA